MGTPLCHEYKAQVEVLAKEVEQLQKELVELRKQVKDLDWRTMGPALIG